MERQIYITLSILSFILTYALASTKASAEAGRNTEAKETADPKEQSSRKDGSARKKRTKKMILVEDDSSHSNREDQKVTTTITLLGFDDGTVQGIDAGYFIRPDLVIAAKFEQSTLALDFFEIDLFKYNVKTFGVYGKKFFGNSFYTNAGLSFKSRYLQGIDLETDDKTEGSKTYSVRYTQETTEIIPALAIGNQWQWDHFTLGCDWFGINFSPMSQSVKKNDVRRVNILTNEDEGESSSSPREIPKSTSVRLLALYLGVCF